MRMLAFASRNAKEILRDPLTLIFGLGLPLVLLALISLLQNSIRVPLFTIQNFAPGMAVFSLSFISLFAGLLIAKDRCGSFLLRLFASPLRAWDYILGYALPLLPVAVAQSAICFAAATLFGLPITANLLLTLAVLLPTAALFIAFGLLLGTLFTDKQVGGLGSLLVNLAALSSGVWFDLQSIGGAFAAVCNALPFAHALAAAKASLAGDYAAILPHLWWVFGYAAATFLAAALVFRHKMARG